MRMAKARAGGHVTLLFSIHSQSTNPLEQGSRGVGFCLQQGAEAIATISPTSSEESELSVSVIDWDGTTAPSECVDPYLVLCEELSKLCEFTCIGKQIDLSLQLELPRSQGFGMSAAGLLASAEALLKASEIDDTQIAATAAHLVERRLSSGLGDVLALCTGGVELRLQPGAPFSVGEAVGFDVSIKPILVWSAGAGKHTADYIDDDTWKASISAAGEDAVERLRGGKWDSNKWPTIISESIEFAEQSGLLGEPHRLDLLDSVNSILQSCNLMHTHVALLCMLGTSVAILPRSLANESEEQIEQICLQLAQHQLEFIPAFV
ncbi:MAG: hypothetical protein QGH90_03030 [Candidatus Poseidoniaceae archaeon]|nr:hypothetical protein [Candidatus Poseidoniaceae archaeon]